MSAIGPWVRDRLTRFKVVTDLVGDRVYPLFVPQRITLKRGDKPALTYRRLAVTGQPSHAGPSGFATTKVRVTAWHEEDYDACCNAIDAVRLAIDGLKGSDDSGFDIRQVTVEGEADDIYAPADGEGIPVFGPYLEFSVVHIEAKKSY